MGDILNEMADNQNNNHGSVTIDGKEVTVDGMFEELGKVMELQKKMNIVLENNQLDPDDFQSTQDKLDKIDEQFYNLSNTVDNVTMTLNELGKLTAKMDADTTEYDQTIDKIEGNLDKLEDSLGQSSADV